MRDFSFVSTFNLNFDLLSLGIIEISLFWVYTFKRDISRSLQVEVNKLMPDYGYTTDAGVIRPIRLSAAKAAAVGFSLGGFTDTEQVSASNSKSTFGLFPRRAKARFPAAPGPDEKVRYNEFILPNIASLSTYGVGSTIPYKELSWYVYDTEPEKKPK